MKKLWLLFLLPLLAACSAKRSATRILCYTKDPGSAWVKNLDDVGKKEGWQITLTDNRIYFQEDSLKEFSAVCMPVSLADSLDYRNAPALKRYLEAGGGGIVAVKDTTVSVRDWPWLKNCFDTPEGTEGTQDKGRVFVAPAAADAALFQKALSYVVNGNHYPDYKQATTMAPPDSSRYTYMVLDQGMDEPMEMCILPEGNVMFIERKGGVKLYDARARQTKTIGHFDVFSGIEDGLLGVALDPNFQKNHWVYFYYAPAGERWYSKLVRLEMHGDTLNMASEKVLLEIPTQRKYCCHSAGYLAFGPGDLLYLSIGDNTNAEETEGYTPVDERVGHELADNQAAAANSQDLRGKVIRIKPMPDGTYEIPDGNLFPKDGSKGRPEIYVMGCRNPYRISIDMKNAFLYWGDVGPDTKVPSVEGGTLGNDEINQARKPGFFGWPYFNGNNEAYPLWDFEKKVERPKQDPQHPVNNSRNNTGIKELPPATPPLIWYGKGASAKFPLVGRGGASAMAGPVYYSDRFKDAPYKLSEYYDGKLFIYEWIRHWIMAVTLDKDGNYVRMEPFLENIPFSAPIDMQFAPDGSIYMLEYGTNWFAKNSDAKLIRITYSEGNRKPVANITADHQYGAAPLAVKLSSSGSVDYDKEDKLKYTWEIEGQKMEGEEVTHTFSKPGVYSVKLTATDNHNEAGVSTLDIKVGNAPPEVTIETKANRSFYWDNTPLDYKVIVKDAEDGTIDTNQVHVAFAYMPIGKDLAVVLANNRTDVNTKFAKGAEMLKSLDCKACHTANSTSVGPSHQDIAHKYPNTEANVNKLAQKIIEGGSGNWGTRTMSAHPDLSKEDAKEMVRYILSLADGKSSLPKQGTIRLAEHIGKGNMGAYLLSASYTDKGANNIEPLTARAHIMLNSPFMQVEDADEIKAGLTTITTAGLCFAYVVDGNMMKFKQLYLDGIKGVKYNIQPQGIGGTIEMRLDKLDGPVVSTIDIPAGSSPDAVTGWKSVAAAMKPTAGLHDVYFVFKSAGGNAGRLFNIDWVYFDRAE